MEIFSQSSNYITQLINKFQNNEIDKNTFNQNILINTIFSHFYFKKENKKYKKIKEYQNSTFQSFYLLEAMQAQSEKQLISKIRDRKSKKIVEESIKSQRQNLLNDLASKKDIKIFAEHTFNTYIPPKNISLSLNFDYNEHNNYNKKYIHNCNIKIEYMNPNLNERENRIITNDFIDTPFCEELDFDKCDNDSITEKTDNDNNNNNKNENKEFLDMIEKEDDEILFYDEKIEKKEKATGFEGWIKKFRKDEIISDFQERKQREQNIVGNVGDLYINLQNDKTIKKEMKLYLQNCETIYEQLSNQEHFHEFTGYLSEKSYKIYMKKMNYNYLIIMLLSFFDFEKFANNYIDILGETQILILFLKIMLLKAGISTTKIYDSVAHVASNKKGHIQFEDYLSCFLPIFDLSDKFQCFKYRFLLFLVKNNDKNIITLNNYRIFCNLIRGKLIYDTNTCNDIIAKLLPILKAKYPKDDSENLNVQHVNIILEFLVNYEYGD